MIEPGESMAEKSADRWTFDGIVSSLASASRFGTSNG
jgi:hypothetical protein